MHIAAGRSSRSSRRRHHLITLLRLGHYRLQRNSMLRFSIWDRIRVLMVLGNSCA